MAASFDQSKLERARATRDAGSTTPRPSGLAHTINVPKEFDATPAPKVGRGKRKVITPKQKVFVSEFLTNGHNATEAALVAFDCKNRGAAQSRGSEVLNHPHVYNFIQAHFMEAEVMPIQAIKCLGDAMKAMKSDEEDHDKRLKAAFKIIDVFSDQPVKQGKAGGSQVADQPDEVVRFIAITGRWPTEKERVNLLKEPIIATATVEGVEVVK